MKRKVKKDKQNKTISLDNDIFEHIIERKIKDQFNFSHWVNYIYRRHFMKSEQKCPECGSTMTDFKKELYCKRCMMSIKETKYDL